MSGKKRKGPAKPRGNPETVVRKLRLRAGLTQIELSEKLGVALRTIVNWEKFGLPPESRGHTSRLIRKGIEEFFDTYLAGTDHPLDRRSRKEIHDENITRMPGGGESYYDLRHRIRGGDDEPPAEDAPG